MPGKDMTLKGLEVFRAVARMGSMQAVAAEMSLSISTVSHHLKTLETGLGVNLLDHGRRPMVLTAAGAVFLRHVDEGLRQIRRGEIELTSASLEEARILRLGLVDDLDGDIAPELAQMLAQLMPDCIFRHKIRPSHEILEMVSGDKLDVAVATRPHHEIPDLIDYPLLRDPFMVAIPAFSEISAEDYIAGRGDIPFLRYAKSQLIGSQIETNLRRSRLTYERRYELESNQMLLAMVAGGAGWAITTAVSYMRARRFHGRIALAPFPGKEFARSLSLFTTELYPAAVPRAIYTILHTLIERHIVKPAVTEMPWLRGSLMTLNAGESGPDARDVGALPKSNATPSDRALRG